VVPLRPVALHPLPAPTWRHRTAPGSAAATCCSSPPRRVPQGSQLISAVPVARCRYPSACPSRRCRSRHLCIDPTVLSTRLL